jgi:hypothetical protein
LAEERVCRLRSVLVINRIFTRLLSAVLATVAFTVAAHATQVALIGDASVSTARPSTNFGSLSNLYVGNGNTAFLQYDLSTLPAGLTSGQIAHATLTVFVNRVNGIGLVTLSPVTSAWSESTITANAQPTFSATPAGMFTASTAGQYVTLDVTSLVQSWIASPGSNFGFALSSGTANLLLDSKENDETGHAPTLDITITSTGATGPQGPVGPAGPIGIPGVNGAPGALGPIGLTGPMGSTGNTGAMGPIGLTGAVGSTGVAGPIGPIGLTGTTGAAGAVGPIGLTGAAGAVGAVGPIGLTGAAGAAGATGPIGLTGAAGATGATGATGPFVGGTYSATVDYPAGSVVDFSGITYLAVQPNGPPVVVTPGSTSSVWVPTTGTATAAASGNSSFLFLFASPGTVGTGGSVLVNDTGNGVTTSSGFTINSTTGGATAQGPGQYWFYFTILINTNDNPTFLVEVSGNQGTPQIVGSAVAGTTQLLTTNGVLSLNTGDTVNVVCFSGCGSSENATFFLQPLGAGGTGATGATGPIGAMGATGAAGVAGPAGPQGPAGSAGGVTSVSAGTITTGGAASLSVTGSATAPTINITVPSIYGDGSNTTASGVCSITSDTNWTSSVVDAIPATPVANDVQCTTFSVSSGVALFVPSGTVIRATQEVMIDGTIVVEPGGAQGLYLSPAIPSFMSGGASPVYGGSGGVALPASALQKILDPGVFGGGNGGMIEPNGTAAYGGGSLVLLAGGSIEISGEIAANGSAGAFDADDSESCSGGGAGGIIILASKVSIGNTGFLSAVGGAGGSGAPTVSSGGGGGGGLIHLFSPANTPGSTTVSGGAVGLGAFSGFNNGFAGGAMGGNGGAAAAATSATAGSPGVVFTTTVADPATLFVR